MGIQHPLLVAMAGMEASLEAALEVFQEPILKPTPSQHMVAMAGTARTPTQLAVVEVAMAVVRFSTLKPLLNDCVDSSSATLKFKLTA